MSHLDLNDVDVDGAVREAEEAVATDTRATFFRKAAITGGTIGSAAFFGGMLPGIAEAAPSKKQDIAILKYALTLEYLEAAFYKEAARDGGLTGQQLEAARLLNTDEQTHVTALRSTIRQLGSRVPSEPNFDFKGTNKGDKFLGTAFVLENVGVRAYLGQAGRLKSKALLAAAASIVTVEARHAAAIALLLNPGAFQTGSKSISPSGSFDRASSMKKILGEVGDTGFITGS
jgi:hypothetical protein